MKKFIILFAVLALVIGSTEAKDYAKMQIKEMKHAQKYGTSQQLLKEKNDNNIPNNVITYNVPLKDPKIMKFGHYEEVSDTDYNKKLENDAKSMKFMQNNLVRNIQNTIQLKQMQKIFIKFTE